MGNMTAFEVALDDFDIQDPTPLDERQTESIAKSNARLDYWLQNLSDVPIQTFSAADTLVSLNLSANKLRFLPDALWTLSRLQVLDLSQNDIEVIPDGIGNLTALEDINLRHNLLTHLPDSFGRNLVNLRKINLEYNRLKMLPPLSNLNRIADMRLRDNRLAALPADFGSIGGKLDLANNALVQFPPCDSCAGLIDLNLDNNRIAGHLPAGIARMGATLTRLSLAGNRVAALPAEIGALTGLTELDLRENVLEDLPREIGSLANLKRLNLSNNRIKDLPPELWTLGNLMALSLGSNLLHGLPAGVTTLSKLRELQLGDNQFTEFPPELTGMTGLGTLLLGWNRITEVPASVGALSRMMVLHLTGNSLVDLPPTINTMRGMRELYLSANRLIGIPDNIDSMKMLQVLDVRRNQMAGLPPCLANLKMIEILHLEDNPPFDLPEGVGTKASTTVTRGTSLSSGRFEAAHADMRGKRPTMEDAVVVQCGYRSRVDEDFFAVYDGHGGDKASRYAAQRHPEILAALLAELEEGEGVKGQLLDERAVKATIKTSFKQTSKEMTTDKIKGSGTTAIICLVLGNVMYIANAGDSRAVCCRDGVATRVSLDHKPDLQKEEKRIRNLGGYVGPNGRVMGALAVSRALGDLELQPLVSSSPHINVLDALPDFLIVACDGVWDVVSDQAACDIVRSELPDVGRAAMKLRDMAYQYGSGDNISVIVVKFK